MPVLKRMSERDLKVRLEQWRQGYHLRAYNRRAAVEFLPKSRRSRLSFVKEAVGVRARLPGGVASAHNQIRAAPRSDQLVTFNS